MEATGRYLLQMACWLAGFWVVYRFLLSKETFYPMNRWFLLAGLLCSLLFPFFPLTYTVAREFPEISTELVLRQGLTEEQQHSSLALNSLLGWIYFAGILFFVFRFLIQTVRLIRLRSRSERIRVKGLVVYRLEKETAPFSFFRNVYVSKSMGDPLVLNTIVAHEKVHIDQCHWADLLLLELARALQWFNPLMHVYRKAMMENHEYLADRGAIGKDITHRNYQAILINQMLGKPVIALASSFTLFHSSKRIKMMKKDKSLPVKRLKLLLVLPLMALIMLGFARPNYVSTENPDLNASANLSIRNGKVFDQWGNALEGVSVSSTSNGNTTRTDANGEFAFLDFASVPEISASKEGYRFVNCLEDSGNGVILMMEVKDKKADHLKIRGKIVDEEGNVLPGTSVIVAHTNVGTVSNVDGEFSLEGVRPDAEIVFSFVGFETQKVKAKKKMKVKMEKQVYRINPSLKVVETNTAPPPPPPTVFDIKGKDGKAPLIVVDGKIHKGDISEIDPETIHSISVIKDESATKAYGPKGENGVIEITTKPQNFFNPNEEVFIVVEDMPEFKGGEKALQEYLVKATANAGEKGTALIGFTVLANGSIDYILVKEGTSAKIKKAASDIVKSMPAWNPGKQRGKAVSVEMEMEIHF
ncbi:MAG TPA: carboxypeptidase-like regulatory domain-containing protein [Prolixibacteraceae bacterium]|nr:carboxypeptidase-like regulatory domain-containing protein [Prolixibacteraceae bacterium]